MNELCEAPAVEATQAPKPRATRKARTPGDQATRARTGRGPKALDPQYTKVSVYLSRETAKRLNVAAVLLDRELSEIVDSVLARHMPGFNRELSRVLGQGDTGDIGQAEAA